MLWTNRIDTIMTTVRRRLHRAWEGLRSDAAVPDERPTRTELDQQRAEGEGMGTAAIGAAERPQAHDPS